MGAMAGPSRVIRLNIVTRRVPRSSSGDSDMQYRKLSIAIASFALATASLAAHAEILFQNLGTGAPPIVIGGYTMTPFDQGAQAAIASGTSLSVIPGGPSGTSLGVTPSTNKRSIGNGWATWSHAYTGAVYSDYESTQVMLTLPADSNAFYVYVEPNPFGLYAITVTSDSGTTSTPIQVDGASGANGFAFYSTAGEDITSVTITSSENFAFGEFGINIGPTTTCASEGYTATKLEWCKNICERGYTGSTLNMWIRRWVERYRQLPYCAVN
jgi:hypothetical protein